MSIALSGPRGYEQQYRISLLLALGILDDNAVKSLLIEVDRGEDAALTLDGSSGIGVWEIQVKSDAADLDWSSLVTVLAHFEEREGDRCTLSRLTADPARALLLVCKARAVDALRGFLRPHADFRLPALKPLAAASRGALATALRDLHAKPKTALDKKRAASCARLALALQKSEPGVLSALGRVIVWEQMSDAEISGEIASILFRREGVPSIATGQIRAALTEEISKARDSRGDALPGIRRVLVEFRASRLRHGSLHTDRGDESAWEAKLLQGLFLPLGGHSKCGKTHLAQELLVKLQARGWSCKVFSDPDDAARFLQAEDIQERACLIDDPFGDLSETRALNRLRSLPDWCRRDRLAIVTCSSEILRQIKKPFHFGRSGPAGLVWHDSTVTDRIYLRKLWSDFCVEGGLAATPQHAIADLLSAMPESELLQPGQLRHLARRPAAELVGCTIEELVAIARYTDESLVLELTRNAPTAEAASIVALACDSWHGAREMDFAFIQCGSDVRPAFFETRGMYQQKFAQKGFPKFPKYPLGEKIDAIRAKLEGWVARGYLNEAGGRWRFSHPDYREAFTQVALAGIRERTTVRLHAERAFSALDPHVCLSAESIIRRAWRDNDGIVREWARDQLFRAFAESLFPAVRQEVFASLLGKLGIIPADEVAQLMRLAPLDFPAEANLIWEGETPWIARGTDAGYFERRELRHRRAGKSEFGDLSQQMLDPARSAAVTDRKLDQVVSYLATHESLPLELPLLQRAGRSKHSFTRADVAELLCGGRLPFGEDAKRFFDDADVRVSAHAIKTCMEAWQLHYRAGNAVAVTEAITTALGSFPIAVIASRALFDIGDPYSERLHIQWEELTEVEKRDLWEAWARWISTVFPAIASYPIHFKDGDLWTSLKEAPKYLTSDMWLRLVDAWLEFIEKRSRVSGLSDYTYGVSDLLFTDSSSLELAQRARLVGRILQLRATDPVIDNLGTMVELWDDLTGLERKAAIELLASERSDIHWLKAAALVRDCPVALQPLAGNRKDFYSQSADEVVASLSPPVLRATLAILSRDTPGSANLYIRYHAKFWNAIGDKIMMDWKHPDQPRMVFQLLMKFDDQEIARAPMVPSCKQLCATASEKGRKLLFELLFQAGNDAPYVHLHEFGSLLYYACSEEERKEFIEEILPRINWIEGRQRTLRKFWGKEWSNLLFSMLPADKLALTVVAKFSDLQPTLIAEVEPLVEAIYRKQVPLLRLTHDLTLELLEKGGSKNSAVYGIVDKARHDGFDLQREERRSYRPKIWRDGWIK